MTAPIRVGLTGLIFVGVAAPATAQEEPIRPLLDRGTQEVTVSGRVDLPGLDEVDYDLDGSYGYFFRDGWEVGGQIEASDTGGADRIELTGFTEYNFRRNNDLVPYIGGGIGLVSADFDESLVIDSPVTDEDGLVFDVEGGVKYFLRSYMAFSAAIDFKVSTEDVFATDEEIEDNLTNLKLGMRYYF